MQSTSNTLPVLKNAQVVDAGALGFYHFITGFADYLVTPVRLTKINSSGLYGAHMNYLSMVQPPEQRYCTEIMLAGESIDRKQDSKPIGTIWRQCCQ